MVDCCWCGGDFDWDSWTPHVCSNETRVPPDAPVGLDHEKPADIEKEIERCIRDMLDLKCTLDDT